MEILEKNPKELTRDYVLRVLKENIINAKLEPGSIISENEISTELGVSRTPVREALIELSRAKLVEVFPQKGSYVSKIDYGIIEELRFLRLVVEAAIIELVCELRTDEDILKMEELVHLQDFYLNRGNSETMLKYDKELHYMFFRIAKKEMLNAIVDSANVHFDRVRKLSFQAQRDHKIIEDHLQIVEAVKKRDARLAREILTKHLSRYQVDKEIIREKYPEWIKE